MMLSSKNSNVKGWCPTLNRPMQSGDGFLVRIPLEFARAKANILRSIADASTRYGNANIDLTMRGNLQLRGVREENYPVLREYLAGLGFVKDIAFNIITSPLAGIDPSCDAGVQQIAKDVAQFINLANIQLPAKFLLVLDGGGIFPLSGVACDAYFAAPFSNGIVKQIIDVLKNTHECKKKAANSNARLPHIGFSPFAGESGIIVAAASFGRIEASSLTRLAVICEKYGNGEVIFSPSRNVILPYVSQENADSALQELEGCGFIINNNDARRNIHACVGSPACSSGLGDTRELAHKWAQLFPNLMQTVHISGCSKGCAYRGKADITITATGDGYDIAL